MKFDKFKTVVPKKTEITTDDADYASRLASLPDPKPKTKILPIVTTAAAAILIVTLVSVWALIGRGVRNQGAAIVPSDEHAYPVTDEPFERLPIKQQKPYYEVPSSEQELYENSDYVIVARVTETLTDGEPNYIEGDHGGPASATTLQKIEIVEQIKGDISDPTINVLTRAYVQTEEDGTQSLIGTSYGSVIPKKNVFYLFYLQKGTYADWYTPLECYGVINIDGLHPDSTKQSGAAAEIMKQIRERFSDLFEKYDRTDDNSQKDITSNSSYELYDRPMTDELIESLEWFYREEYVFLLPDFNKDDVLTQDQIIAFCENTAVELRSDGVLSKEELAGFAYDKFRYDMEFSEDIPYENDFLRNYSLASVEFVSYSVGDTLPEGGNLAQIEIQGYDALTTVRFVQRGELILDYFVSVITDETKKGATLDSEFQTIAEKYRLESIPMFELGTQPSLMYASCHVAQYVGKEKWVHFENDHGISGYGIPLDIFNEAVTELYGEYGMDEGYTHFEDVTTSDFDTLGLIDIGDGQIVVPIADTNSREVKEYTLIDAYGFEYQSQSAFRMNYEIEFADGTTQRYELCYLREPRGFGIYPARLISHKEITPDSTE